MTKEIVFIEEIKKDEIQLRPYAMVMFPGEVEYGVYLEDGTKVALIGLTKTGITRYSNRERIKLTGLPVNNLGIVDKMPSQ